MIMLKGYEHMVDFFTSFEWWKTEPHDELVNNGAYCLAKPGETYDVPVMAIMAASPARADYEARLRAIFPNLRRYEAWEGSGHFLMMESPERFNRALEEFLAGLKR